MCGIIVGSSTNKVNADKLNLLFLYNQDRGKHSCGFYNHDKETAFHERVQKTMGEVKDKTKFMNSYEGTSMFIGHVRQATAGHVVTLANAHPFLFGNVVGIHNGTVKNWKILRDEYDLSSKCDIDSKIFFEHIDKTKNWDIVKEIDGAANLVWYDKRKEDILNVIKLPGRTLFRGTITKGKDITMYISSVREGLDAIGCDNVKEFKDNYYYTIKAGKILSTKKFNVTPREKLSEERRFAIHGPLKVVKTPEKKTAGTDKKSLAVATPSSHVTKTENDDSKWILTTFRDKTEWRRRVETDATSFEIMMQECTYSEERQMWITTLYFTDGGYKEIRMGLPSIHFNVFTGLPLQPLMPKASNINVSEDFDMNRHVDLLGKVTSMVENFSEGIRNAVDSASSMPQLKGRIEKEMGYIDELLIYNDQELSDTLNTIIV